MVSLRGWHIVTGGLIWVTSSVLTYMNLMGTLVLGSVFLLLGVGTIAIGMLKIVKYERYENKDQIDTGRQMSPITGQQPYNTFANENVTNSVEFEPLPTPVVDTNDPNIRFSKKFQNQI